MATHNDITGDSIYSAGDSDDWDENYDRIFGTKPPKNNPLDWEDGTEEKDCECCGKSFMGFYEYPYCKLCSN